MRSFDKRSQRVVVTLLFATICFTLGLGGYWGWRYQCQGLSVVKHCVDSVQSFWVPQLNQALYEDNEQLVQETMRNMLAYPCIDQLRLTSQGRVWVIPEHDNPASSQQSVVLTHRQDGSDILLGELKIHRHTHYAWSMTSWEFLLYVIWVALGAALFWWLAHRLLARSYSVPLAQLSKEIAVHLEARQENQGSQGSQRSDANPNSDTSSNEPSDQVATLQKLIANLCQACDQKQHHLGVRKGQLSEQLSLCQAKYAVMEQKAQELKEQSEQQEKQLNEASLELQRIKDLKSDFLSNMSHEIRTPMHAILSFADLGIERLENTADKRSCEYFGFIGDSGRRLMLILNNLLDLSKMESGKIAYDIAEHKIRDVIRLVQEELSEKLQEKEITLKIEQGESQGTAQFDVNRIAQLMRNLLLNAINFSATGKTIQIKIEDVEYLSDFEGVIGSVPGLQVEVIDQGIGIPPGEHEMIFSKFALSTKTATGAGGSGLGLSICREIVRAHFGEIAAFDAPGGGSVFRFTLPKVVIRRRGRSDL